MGGGVIGRQNCHIRLFHWNEFHSTAWNENQGNGMNFIPLEWFIRRNDHQILYFLIHFFLDSIPSIKCSIRVLWKFFVKDRLFKISEYLWFNLGLSKKVITTFILRRREYYYHLQLKGETLTSFPTYLAPNNKTSHLILPQNIKYKSEKGERGSPCLCLCLEALI